ncbi:MAG: hypothetical protein U9Q21_00350 [Candidatus Auribacterota bacterium]|nr:hypothetical protein [Candidatus Auribacterota bacterium]
MLFRVIGLLLLIFLLASCDEKVPDYILHRLPSGKKIKLIGVGEVSCTGDNIALMLKYKTDYNIGNSVALRREVEEIWQYFRAYVERAGFKNAVISVDEPLRKKVIKVNRSYNFAISKQPGTAWEFSKPRRCYDI